MLKRKKERKKTVYNTEDRDGETNAKLWIHPVKQVTVCLRLNHIVLHTLHQWHSKKNNAFFTCITCRTLNFCTNIQVEYIQYSIFNIVILRYWCSLGAKVAVTQLKERFKAYPGSMTIFFYYYLFQHQKLHTLQKRHWCETRKNRMIGMYSDDLQFRWQVGHSTIKEVWSIGVAWMLETLSSPDKPNATHSSSGNQRVWKEKKSSWLHLGVWGGISTLKCWANSNLELNIIIERIKYSSLHIYTAVLWICIHL